MFSLSLLLFDDGSSGLDGREGREGNLSVS